MLTYSTSPHVWPSAPVRPRMASAAVSDDDRAISAQARALGPLNRMLAEIPKRVATPPRALVDLGCGMGALSLHVARRLGTGRIIGADCDLGRLNVAAARGIETHAVDLDHERLPLPCGSAGVVTCFGLLAYLPTYDCCLSEAARLLEDGGWFLLSMPNLGSWTNRLSLLLGYQPAQVAVSHHRRAGTLRRHRQGPGRSVMPPLLHAATVRCMRELLDTFGFDVVVVRGFNPVASPHPVLARLGARCPSLSRRFLILARKRPSVPAPATTAAAAGRSTDPLANGAVPAQQRTVAAGHS